MRCHSQANHASPTGAAELGAAALPSPTPEPRIQTIALDHLSFAPGRRRKMSPRSLKDLAARIHAGGHFKSLVVVPKENAQFYVVAGEQRLAALQLLARQRQIAKTFPVPCRVIEAKARTEANPVSEARGGASDIEADERRRCFLVLRNHCPGLLTGSEFAARQCFNGG